jgi:two-component system CheB/CheR fusion protein
MKVKKTYEELSEQIDELRAQLQEAHEIISAIHKGEVDAFVVNNDGRHELYTLKSADKTYRLFIEKMNEGAITLNRQNIVLYSNSAFASLLNTPLENVIGSYFEDLIPAEFRIAVNELIKNAWNLQESKGEIMLSAENKPVPVLLSLNALETDGGIALSIIAADLSLQKEAQEQKIVMEKKDEFITIASHELKTPVTSIKGYVQLLKHNFQKDGNENAAGILGKVDTQINKLAALISDLLDVKKIENGQLQYHEEEFDFNELVDEVVEESSRVITRHTIIQKPGETRRVMGDRNKIGQVITNFIDNAGKYSPVNSEIQVSTDIEGGSIRLSVKDQGIGIPSGQQLKIFDRFYRVSGEKENTYAGLGLGLYISSEFIRRHNGTIGVESEEGNGSTFYFTIPVVS